MALALELKADLFLTDDTSARTFAESLKIPTRGSLGVILWNAGRAFLPRDDAERMLAALFGSTLWISEEVKKEAKAALKRLYMP